MGEHNSINLVLTFIVLIIVLSFPLRSVLSHTVRNISRRARASTKASSIRGGAETNSSRPVPESRYSPGM